MGKENRSAVEMATSIGSEPSQLDEKWSSLGKINFTNILESLGEELDFDQSEWQSILALSGVWMLNNLDNQIVDLKNKKVEQNTAVELRKMLGVPLSLLAMPVFIELEKMEVNAKKALKEEAAATAQILEQINNTLLYMVQLVLAEQINLVEEEISVHQAALDASQKEAEGMPALGTTMQHVEGQFKEKMEQLQERKNLLTDTFSKVGDNLKSSIGEVFETTVFSAKDQSPVANAIT